MKPFQLGVLGAGNMGYAIAEGAVRAGRFSKAEILLFNRGEDKRARHAAEGYAVTDDFTSVYGDSARVILGIKPQNFAEILPALQTYRALQGRMEPPLIISIAAGVPFARMEAALGADTPMIRVMPNTPLLVGQGACALVGNAAASDGQLEETQALFASMGCAVVYEQEEMLNEIIPYNGSFPAYVYAFLDGMTQSAEQHGVPRADALKLLCQTMIGSAQMALESGRPLDALIREVCSPGGTTIEAVRVLEQRGLSDILAEASDKCIARAYELGKS